ncbi:MAG: hypothetical protein FJW24_01970 [Acidimicrobiia bacterium]|nr:hypothetical protein [Acidimicrobiia bacterium]
MPSRRLFVGVGKSPINRVWIAGILVGLSAAVITRVWLFQDLKPNQDHAFSMQWIQSLRSAEYFWPAGQAGDSLIIALSKDDKSGLHTLLCPIHAAGLLVLTLVAQSWFYLGSFFVGANSVGQIALSIAAQAAAVGMLWIIGFSARNGGPAIATLAIIFAAGASFLHGFAPLGAHNVALLSLMAALLAFDRVLSRATMPEGPSRREIAVAFILQAVALYTYYSIVFLLPVAVFLSLLFLPDIPGSWRVRLILWHGMATVAALVPVAGIVILEIASGRSGANQSWLYFLTLTVTPSPSGGPLSWQSALEWFRVHADMFSVFGLGLGLVGLVWLAWRGRCPLPLAIVFVHLLVSIVMTQFRQYDRTSVYAVPFLALGMAAAVVAAWRTRILWLRLAMLVIVGGHIAVDTPRLRSPDKTPAWGHYYHKQGSFRALMGDVSRHLPPNAVLMLSDYGRTHRWRAWSYGTGGPEIATPLETLAGRDARQLDRYPPTGMRNDRPVFILLPAEISLDPTVFARIVCDNVARACGRPAGTDYVTRLSDPDLPGRFLSLYRVNWALARLG